MRLAAIVAAGLLAAACGKDDGLDPEQAALLKRREAELAARAEATRPKPPEPAKPPPSKEQLVGACKGERDAVACQGACAMDDWESCHLMGLNYEEAKGVPSDFDAARRFHIRACDGGFGQGCYAAGIFYDYGKSVPKNPRKAQEYFKKACDLKVEAGCKELEPK